MHAHVVPKSYIGGVVDGQGSSMSCILHTTAAVNLPRRAVQGQLAEAAAHGLLMSTCLYPGPEQDCTLALVNCMFQQSRHQWCHARVK